MKNIAHSKIMNLFTFAKIISKYLTLKLSKFGFHINKKKYLKKNFEEKKVVFHCVLIVDAINW